MNVGSVGSGKPPRADEYHSSYPSGNTSVTNKIFVRHLHCNAMLLLLLVASYYY